MELGPARQGLPAAPEARVPERLLSRVGRSQCGWLSFPRHWALGQHVLVTEDSACAGVASATPPAPVPGHLQGSSSRKPARRSPPVMAVTSSRQGPALPAPSPGCGADLLEELEETTWPGHAGCPGTLQAKAITKPALEGLLAGGEARLETGACGMGSLEVGNKVGLGAPTCHQGSRESLFGQPSPCPFPGVATPFIALAYARAKPRRSLR